MKLTIDEIRARVMITERERQGWKSLAQTWEKMWALDAGFKQDWRDAVEKEGREQVTLPDPLNIVNLGKRLISTSPRIEVPPADVDDPAERNADKIKAFLTALWQRINWQQGRIVLDDAIWFSLVRGRVAAEVKWVKDDLPKLIQKRNFPILVRTLDPYDVGIKRGANYVEYAYHKYKTDRADARQRYPRLALWKQANNDDIQTEDTQVTITDFWWTNPNTGRIWNAILVDEEFAKPCKETDYPYVPIIEVFGDSAPTKDKTYEGMSILHGLEELWPYKCRLASNLGTAVLWAVWPFVAVQNDNGQVVDDIQVRPGATVPVPAGTRFDTIKAQVDLNVLQAMLAQIDAGVQQTAFPNVMYGDGGNMAAGYGINLLSDAAKGRIKSFLEYLELFVTHINELVLALIDEFGGSSPVHLWGQQAGTEDLYRLGLKRTDIGGRYDNQVKLRPNLPQDDLQVQTLGVRLADGKYISRQTLREKYLSVAMPENEQDRIFAEMAFENPEIMKNVTILRLMELFPNGEWKDLVKGTSLEQLAEQLIKPTPPPPPPMMPDMGMMGPGGPPPGMPPEMMGPPGMPPGGPPPGMMPPGMPPGGAPVQPPGMPTPLGGGIPPEMAGQMTPEAMGLPPGMPPEMFAQIMGRPLPPGEELAALAAGGGMPPGVR